MLSEKIKALRNEMGITQTELSRKLNSEFGLKTDRVMISKWETGYQTPVFSTLVCLAKLFGVSLDELNGTKTENSEKDARELVKFALFSGKTEITQEMLDDVFRFAKFLEEKEAAKNENK